MGNIPNPGPGLLYPTRKRDLSPHEAEVIAYAKAEAQRRLAAKRAGAVKPPRNPGPTKYVPKDLTPKQAEAKALADQRAQGLPTTPTDSPLTSKGVDIKAMQKFLKGKGYAIKVDGIMGKSTKSAVTDWQKGVGKRNPKAWSTAQGTASGGTSSPVSTDNHHPTSGASSTRGTSASPGSAISNMTPPPGQALDPHAWDALQTIDPKYAGTEAGLQYDPQIAQTKLQQSRQVADAAQALHDIQHWYGQTQGALHTAAGRNATANSQAVGDIGKATAAILSSLGGSANAGSGMIAAQGDANAAAQSQMGQAEQQYQNDLAPLLQQESAGAMTNQRNLNTKTSQDLASTLSSLMGQKGQAKASALMQIIQANNAIQGQKIQGQQGTQEYNNTLGQQGFQNNVTLETLRQAAALNDANVNYYTAAAKGAGGTGFVPWAKLNAAQKQQLINSAIQNNIVDSNGAILPQYAKNPKAAWIAARQYMRGQGYNSAFKNGASDMGAYQNITDLLAGGLNKAYGIYSQRQALVNGQ